MITTLFRDNFKKVSILREKLRYFENILEKSFVAHISEKMNTYFKKIHQYF